MTTKIETVPIGGGGPIAELPAEIIRYGYRLNRAGAASFSLALDHPLCTRETIWPGEHEVVITRNGAQVWAGPVLTANETDEAGNRVVEFGAEGLLAYANRWHLSTALEFDGVDQFEIARQLIEHHQDKAGGDFNIDTSDNTMSGVTRDRSYPPGKNIGVALQELANVENGFDFRVNPETRVLELFYPEQGGRRDDLVWEPGIRDFSRTVDATSQASQVLGFGEGEGADQVRGSRQNAGAVSTYGLTNRVFDDQEVSRQATLLAHVDRELAYHRNPVQELSVTVGTGQFNPFTYGVGVSGRLKYSSSYDAVNEVRRMVGFDVEWNQGDERARLILAPVL